MIRAQKPVSARTPRSGIPGYLALFDVSTNPFGDGFPPGRRLKEAYMLTVAEKGYLAMTLFFLATGSGIKAYRHVSAEIGPSIDSLPAAPLSQEVDSDTARDSAAGGDASPGVVRDSSIPVSTEVAEYEAAPPTESRALVRDSVPPGSEGRKTAASRRKGDFAGKVSINRAAASELTVVRGLGDKTARAIVEHRRAHGPYRRLQDLLQVKGIGEKKLEKLIPYLIL